MNKWMNIERERYNVPPTFAKAYQWYLRQNYSSSRNCPKDFQMVMPFLSNDDNPDDDIKSISSTCSSQAWILLDKSRTDRLNYKRGNWNHEASPAILLFRFFARVGRTKPNPLDEPWSEILSMEQKACGQSIIPTSRNSLSKFIQISSTASYVSPGTLQVQRFLGSWFKLLQPWDRKAA